MRFVLFSAKMEEDELAGQVRHRDLGAEEDLEM